MPNRSVSFSRQLVLATVLVAGLVVSGSVPGGLRTSSGSAADQPRSAAEARQQRKALRDQKAEAARALDAAKADDAAVAAALAAITDAVNAQIFELDEARRELESANAVAVEAQAQVEAADAERETLRARIGQLAVEGFLDASNPAFGDSVLSSSDPSEGLRRASLLKVADSNTGDLLETLRGVREDRAVAEDVAQRAVAQASQLERDMADLVAALESQRAVQAQLKAELEARVAQWQSEVEALESEERALSTFIREQEAKLAPRVSSPAVPGVTSSTGFIWPLNAAVTSEFGYRVHPIFQTRRLHAGIDLGAPSGNAIRAAKGGTVISAGPYGGYGNAVVIAHGGGLSTLYAHQSKLAVKTGDTVSRGDVIGYVGSTGQSTGPHLHFEVRQNGDPVNPRRFLP